MMHALATPPSPSRRPSSIAGVVPPQHAEATVMTVWPSIASTGLGCFLGRIYAIDVGLGPFTIGRLLTLLSIPVPLVLYLSMRLPWRILRYRLTNRRVAIERGIAGRVEQYVDLARFDTIDVEVQPGQAWYPAGDLVFRLAAVETLRLPGVRSPESFRQACLKVRQSYVSVAESL